jgi:hypothetical protein
MPATLRGFNGTATRPAAHAQDVSTVSSACAEVRSSSLMRHLLKLALEIGNFLNASSPQGAAVGFHLETLLRLRDVKSTNNKAQTLLHFVARYASYLVVFAVPPVHG